MCECVVCVGVWVSCTRIKVAELQATFADTRLTFPGFFIVEVGWIERPLKEVPNHCIRNVTGNKYTTVAMTTVALMNKDSTRISHIAESEMVCA